MSLHSFHIPVMGIGFTVDTPVKVAAYGINSTVSLVDDLLLEKLRSFYSAKIGREFVAIEKSEDDFRAKRVTAYLNLINDIVKEKFAKLKASAFEKGSEIVKALELLPLNSEVRKLYDSLCSLGKSEDKNALEEEIRSKLSPGAIEVNIMTKLDTVRYKGNEQLPTEYNDAHAALRGFAKSELSSSLVLSAGINKKLYNYITEFEDFFPDVEGKLRKKLILKVSDYRSALVQGKMLAKKGIWVSEYRIESGLNCGGHVFPTDGYLLGPILSEFRDNRDVLLETCSKLYNKALTAKELHIADSDLKVRVTVQGGVGTHEEHQSLIDTYGVDSIGWGSPFLLVPEVTNVDETTLQLLEGATEDDLYVSDVSPLGVKFNNLRGNSKDIEKQSFIDEGTPGVVCHKRHLALNTEYEGAALCPASRVFQKKKIEELQESRETLNAEEYEKELSAITEKACICVGLSTAALMNNNVSDEKIYKDTVSICPGPAVVSFNKRTTLQGILDHIYGKKSLFSSQVLAERPHMFVRELGLYVEYLSGQVSTAASDMSDKIQKSLTSFRENLLSGIGYYRDVLQENGVVQSALNAYEVELNALSI